MALRDLLCHRVLRWGNQSGNWHCFENRWHSRVWVSTTHPTAKGIEMLIRIPNMMVKRIVKEYHPEAVIYNLSAEYSFNKLSISFAYNWKTTGCPFHITTEDGWNMYVAHNGKPFSLRNINAGGRTTFLSDLKVHDIGIRRIAGAVPNRL